MLDLFNRSAIIALAALCVAATFALTPSRARGSIADVSTQPTWRYGRADTHDIALAPILRDPFAEPTPRTNPVAAPPTTSPSSETTSSEAIPSATIEPLPNNLPVDTVPGLPGTASEAPARGSRVTAVVTGPHPYAMVQIGGANRIEGLGDRISGQRILAIGLDGIRLQDGERLTVDAMGQP